MSQRVRILVYQVSQHESGYFSVTTRIMKFCETTRIVMFCYNTDHDVLCHYADYDELYYNMDQSCSMLYHAGYRV